MNDTATKTRVSSRTSGAAPLRSVLVPVDLTAAADRVVGRVALLPLARGARVTLLHVVPDNLGTRDRRCAHRDATRALVADARRLRESLSGAVIVQPLVKVSAVAREIAASAKVVRAELVVMGRGGGRAIREAFLGSTAERVIRQSQLPVLVVRLAPRRAYARPALALDLEQPVDHVVELMLRVVQPPRPLMQVVHAFDAPYHGLVYPSIHREDAEAQRRELQFEASQKLLESLARAVARAKVSPGDAPAWTTHVRYGSPRLVIQNAVRRARTDLLALGTHGYSGVAHAFLGTVAGDVARSVACDVLIVPPR
jgi:nucleotide-binding universal stress UspA family protein